VQSFINAHTLAPSGTNEKTHFQHK